MTHEQRNAAILRKIAEYTKTYTASSEIARATLIREGLIKAKTKKEKEAASA